MSAVQTITLGTSVSATLTPSQTVTVQSAVTTAAADSTVVGGASIPTTLETGIPITVLLTSNGSDFTVPSVTTTLSNSTFALNTVGVIVSTHIGHTISLHGDLGNITSILTFPETCSTLPYTFLWSITGTSTFWHDPKAAPECWPSGFSTKAYEPYAPYSPGVCLTNYPAVAWIPANTTIFRPARSFCCPSGRTLAENGACFTTITTPTTVVSKAPTQILITETFVAVDWAVIADWASSDLNKFVPASAPALTTRGSVIKIVDATSATSISSATAAQSTSPIPTESSSVLGAGSIAGIIIGVVTAIAIAAVAGWFFARARWQRDQAIESDPHPQAELEAQFSGMAELATKTRSHELATKHNTAEMHVDPAGLDASRA